MKRKKVKILLFVPILAIASCYTYQPYSALYQYGYSDTRLDDNIFRVSYIGAYNQPEIEVFESLLYRCAEITLEHDYDYFLMEAKERSEKEQKGAIVTPNQYIGLIAMGYTNRQVNLTTMITCGIGEKPEMKNAFNARKIVEYSNIPHP